MFRDSGGVITDYEKAAMQRSGRVDVALIAVSAAYLHTLTAQRALEQMRTYKPDVYIPGHHDAPFSTRLAAQELRRLKSFSRCRCDGYDESDCHIAARLKSASGSARGYDGAGQALARLVGRSVENLQPVIVPGLSSLSPQ